MHSWRLSYCLIVLIVFVTLFTIFEIQIVDLRDKNAHLDPDGSVLWHCLRFNLEIYIQNVLRGLHNVCMVSILEQLVSRVQTQAESQVKVEDTDENLVVIYNRVPKTGSTSFVGVAYDLCKRNKFHVLHINITANMHVLSLPNQYKFVQNITRWTDMKPALYHGHMAFLDFARLGATEKPLYINIVRKPLDRLVSYYYFLRYGDNFRPTLIRRKHGDKMTFDECVEKEQSDCEPSNMWLQIPFFCGHSAECWKPGNKWALERAKENLLNNYLLVGITEQMEDFIMVLEATLPRIFRGATEHYMKSNKSHLRQTVQKNVPSAATVAKIQQSAIWRMENELYEFAVQQFNFIKKRTLQGPGEKIQSYMYEKIRPK